MQENDSNEYKQLKEEEMKLMDIKVKLQDQLRRLQVEELAIRSIMSSEKRQKPLQSKEGKK